VPSRFLFGEFEFDADRHELRRAGADVLQLAPQPALLLHLLAERGGAIVTRDEIRQRLWPDTHVDFDASLHFCVRQVRTALGDSASEPRYVQNVPRRGYRLIPAVTVDGAAALAPDRAVAAASPGRSRLVWVTASIVLLAAIASTAWFAGRTREVEATPRVRIAIMPFQPPIAERILADLSTIAGASVGLVGPTTTSAYAGSDADLRRLAADYRVDYVINGRPIGSDGRPRVLAELIRVSDGVHVWVRPYEELEDGRRVAEDITRNVARVLKLGGG
jgi:DNA-binding winged helix-turn-helix (wHTH) protein/TolB-like protein